MPIGIFRFGRPVGFEDGNVVARSDRPLSVHAQGGEQWLACSMACRCDRTQDPSDPVLDEPSRRDSTLELDRLRELLVGDRGALSASYVEERWTRCGCPRRDCDVIGNGRFVAQSVRAGDCHVPIMVHLPCDIGRSSGARLVLMPTNGRAPLDE